MRIPGVDQAIGHLIKWSEKDEWEPYRRQVFAEHFELIMERFDISEQEIVDLLDEAFGMVCGFVLEDFFTARFGEEGELNVVDSSGGAGGRKCRPNAISKRSGIPSRRSTRSSTSIRDTA